MSFIEGIWSLSESADSNSQEERVRRRLLLSKMTSLNSTLQNLIQKKIRIDLEIKRTKKKLSKLKSTSQTEVKTRIELEGFSYDHFNPSDLALLESQVGKETYQELFDLDGQVYMALQLLNEVEKLPLYED